MQELESWIFEKLVDKDEFLDASVFDSKMLIHFTPLSNNFVATIINGSGTAATYKLNSGENQYNKIVRQVALATKAETAHWFYYTVIDNAVGQLNDVWECNYEYSLDYPLEKFEREPADQGGVSYLGLIGTNKTWLLLITYEPGESLKITFHGPELVLIKLKGGLVKCN